MINAAVLIEQSLDLVSFRPRLRVPLWVSALGLLGSLLAMFIINATVSFVAIVVTLAVYAVLARRHLDAPFEDVRSGLFVSIAEWAAKKVSELPTMQERAWKPNLLVPIEQASELRGMFLTLQDITFPQGSVKAVGLCLSDETDEAPADDPEDASADIDGDDDGDDDALTSPDALEAALAPLTHAFRERGVFASSTVIEAPSYHAGLRTGMQALRGAFFRPNVVFLPMPETPAREASVRVVIREAEREHLGSLLYAPHPHAGLGQRQTINVWIRERGPEWRIQMDIGNLDLMLLTGYKLAQNWDARLRLITVVEEDPEEQARAQDFLEKLIDLARIPHAEALAVTAPFHTYVRNGAPQADLSLFGLLPDLRFDFPRRMVRVTESTCMFVRDSGRESVLA
jgi:hypothetical protein